MFRALVVLFALTLGLLGFVPRPAGSAATPPTLLSGTVTWVYDADTLEIAPHGKVRLLGIDAPEKGASSRDGKFLDLGIPRTQLRAVHATGLAWCLRQVKGAQVTLTFDQSRFDRHGRLLAYVYLADGRLLNRALLEEGLVIVYRRFPIRLKADFLAVEAKARRSGVGLWGKQPASPPIEQKKSNSMSTQTTQQTTIPAGNISR